MTVTVVGRNDAPTSTPIGTQSANDGDPVTLSIASHFGDPDTIDTLTFGASNLPPGLTIDPSTGLIHGTINSNASVSGPYSVTVTATDPHGATTSQTFTWNVANQLRPRQTIWRRQRKFFNHWQCADERFRSGQRCSCRVIRQRIFVEPRTADQRNDRRHVRDSVQRRLLIQPRDELRSSGRWSVVITSVTYTVSDGQGGTSTATVSITVTGTNDTPIVAAIPAQDSTGRDVINLDVSSFFSDAETHEPLTFARATCLRD